ncbi:MAG: hypothetical protein Q9168_007944 [Polycauliona sp. 1 TL-2023]
MPITKELSITMKQYGRFADRSRWNDIYEALNDFEHRFSDDKNPTDAPAYQTCGIYRSGSVGLHVISQHSGPELLSGKEFARVVKTIDNLFFVYKDQPREISIAISKNGLYLHDLTLSWDSTRNNWPQHLPWTFPADHLGVEIYHYGRDFAPSTSFDDEWWFALQAIRDELIREQPLVGPPAKSSYTSNIVKLDIVPPPGAARVFLQAESMVEVLYLIQRELIGRRSGHVFGPREFAANIKDLNGRILARMWLTYIDSDGPIAQE